jgi:hypothetical protein
VVDEDVQKFASTYGVDLSGYRELRSGTDLQQRRAEAEAARQRADELAREAKEKIAQHDSAKQQAQGASADLAAMAARREAAKYDAG